MMKLQVITNNHWRNVLYGYELTKKELLEFDYIDEEELPCHSFIRYRGGVYDLSEFMRTPDGANMALDWPELSAWDGYQSDSFFSGVLVTYSDDCEQVKMATYIS